MTRAMPDSAQLAKGQSEVAEAPPEDAAKPHDSNQRSPSDQGPARRRSTFGVSEGPSELAPLKATQGRT
jgi:hypothetical protein